MELTTKTPLTDFSVEDFFRAEWISAFVEKHPFFKGENELKSFLSWMCEALENIEFDSVEPTLKQIDEAIEDINGQAFDFDDDALNDAINAGARYANDNFIRLACLYELAAGDLVLQLRERFKLNFIMVEECIVFIGPQPLGEFGNGLQFMADNFFPPCQASKAIESLLFEKLGIKSMSIWGKAKEVERLEKVLIDVYPAEELP